MEKLRSTLKKHYWVFGAAAIIAGFFAVKLIAVSAALIVLLIANIHFLFRARTDRNWYGEPFLRDRATRGRYGQKFSPVGSSAIIANVLFAFLFLIYAACLSDLSAKAIVLFWVIVLLLVPYFYFLILNIVDYADSNYSPKL